MTKIAHISDIHWRSLKRHEEYKIVFERLFNSLRKESPDLIFIGGDIVHSKTQGISPEIIDNLTWWFNSLASIAPTHIILGNHDGLILNKDRQDAISPIIDALNNDRLFLYKKSGVYTVTQEKDQTEINWCVFSCFDEENWKNVLPKDSGINIACFHGAVYGSKTDVDWELEGEVNLSFFNGFDFGFLGDIHKLQYLDNEKRVAYPGSTIQQNYGEDIKKGYLIWEIENKYDFKSRFISIKNPHPYITIDWQGNIEDTIRFCEKIIKKSRFRIRSRDDISQAEIKILHHYLKKEKLAHEIVYQNIHDSKENKNINSENINEEIFDIRKTKDRSKLLKDFYIGISEDKVEKINTLFKSHLDMVPESLIDTGGQKWSISKLDFENTFSYGKDNSINFKNLNGVIGLFGNNRAGKSSIPGTIMYTLFNTSDRGSLKNQDIVNIRKGKCKSKIVLETGTKIYEIIRETTKKTNRKGITSATTNLSLKNISDEADYYDESDEQRRETEKVLRKLIGNADDFLYTSFASQGEMNTFIKEKSSARKSVLSKFLHLEIYESLYKASKENHIVLKNKLKNVVEKNWSQLIVDAENKISLNNQQSTINSEQLESLKEKEIELKVKYREIEKNIKEHPSGYTYEKALDKLDFIKNKIQSNKNDIKKYEDLINDNTLSLDKITKFKDNFSIEVLEQDKSKLDNLKLKLNNFKLQKSSSQKEINKLNKELKILDQVPCEDKFLNCMFIKNAHSAKTDMPQFKKELSELESAIYEVNNVVNKLQSENLDQKIKKYNDILKKEYKLKVDIESFNEKIFLLKEKLENNLKDLDKFTELTAELKEFSNDNYSLKLKKIKTEINEVNDLIYSKEKAISKYNFDNFELKNEIKKIDKDKEEYNNLVDEWKIFDLFVSSVSKKGIPSMLIRNSLPKINKEIKSILNGVVNFDIILEDNNNSLDVYIDYGDSKRIIECASGMEKMITSIAIRVALINISFLPKSDIFIIDEGFGALDDTNIESCARLLKSLKKFFKTILVISHVDAIKDIVDKNLEISVKGCDSYVEYK